MHRILNYISNRNSLDIKLYSLNPLMTNSWRHKIWSGWFVYYYGFIICIAYKTDPSKESLNPTFNGSCNYRKILSTLAINNREFGETSNSEIKFYRTPTSHDHNPFPLDIIKLKKNTWRKVQSSLLFSLYWLSLLLVKYLFQIIFLHYFFFLHIFLTFFLPTCATSLHAWHISMWYFCC